MVIGEAGYFFAYHSDTVAQQSRNWQERFRRTAADIGSVPLVRASARKPLPVDPVGIGVSKYPHGKPQAAELSLADPIEVKRLPGRFLKTET